jgi:hypothetical protein
VTGNLSPTVKMLDPLFAVEWFLAQPEGAVMR